MGKKMQSPEPSICRNVLSKAWGEETAVVKTRQSRWNFNLLFLHSYLIL